MGLFDGKSMENLTSSITGNIPKAMLCVRAVEKLGTIKAIGKNDGNQGLSPEVESAVNDAKDTYKDLLKKAQASLDGKKTASFKDVSSIAERHGYIALEVQYNPNTLRFDSSAGRQYNYTGSGQASQLQVVTMPAATTLSCDLLFDDTNVQDAFMLEGNPVTSMSTGNLYSTLKSVWKGKYSVQRQMEGLLSLMSIPQAKHVIFYWGAMCFRGEVTEVTTTYNMFNKSGYPIRGTLHLAIRQGDANMGKDRDILDYDDTYYMKKFEEVFKTEKKGKSVFSQATNNNLLNLKL